MDGLPSALLDAWRWSADAWEALAPRIRKETGLRVWNPQRYGIPVYERFAAHYLPEREGALLAFGLNPGKYGMSQTGIPFTDVTAARERLPALDFAMDAPGLAPASLRPFLKRYRIERSSQSVYAFLRLAYGDEARGWRDLCAVSPCGLLFLEQDGTNVTPADARLARRDDVQSLRREVAERFLAVAKPRAVLLLGQDVARVVRPLCEAAVGAERVVVTDHPVARGPGRRGPAWWADDTLRRLQEAGLAPR